MSTPARSLKHRPDIQGLRAIAVALVVLAHAGFEGLAGGFVGVDVFFVLSGYLITGLLLEEKLATGTIRYGQFLARRIRRLLPAMLSISLFVLLVASVVLTAFEMRMQARSFPYAVAWISNFFFAFAERNYFKALQDDDLFLHTWSLGVEEQFYLIWPWLIFVLAGMAVGNGRREARGMAVAVALAAISCVGFAVSLLLIDTSTILAFYMMPSRIWQFALGAVVYVGLLVATKTTYLEPPSRRRQGASVFGVLGAILVLGSATLLHPDIAYPGWYALAPSVGAALLIAAGTVDERNGVTKTLSLRPVVWIGDRSYSVYLWHWPILIIGEAVGVARLSIGLFGLVVLTVGLATLSFRYIEYPLWKGKYRGVAPRRVLSTAAVAVLATVVAFNVLGEQVYGVGGETSLIQERDPRNDADRRVYSASRNCDSGHSGTQLVPCPLGSSDGTRLAVLVGDSIGAQWSPLISELLSDPEWQIVVLTKSACAIVDRIWHYERAGGEYVVCAEWREKAMDFIDESSPELVFIGSASTYRFSRSDWVDGTGSILDRVTTGANYVVLLAGTPALSFDGPSCLEDPWRFSFRLVDGKRECEEARTGAQPESVSSYLQEAAKAFDRVVVLDLIDLVCPDKRCAAATPGGTAVFRDTQHVTATFAESLVPVVRTRLLELGLTETLLEPGNASH